MTSTAIRYLLVIFSLCLGLVLARFLIGYYYPQLTPIKCLCWFLSGMRIGFRALKVILEKKTDGNLFKQKLENASGICWYLVCHFCLANSL